MWSERGFVLCGSYPWHVTHRGSRSAADVYIISYIKFLQCVVDWSLTKKISLEKKFYKTDPQITNPWKWWLMKTKLMFMVQTKSHPKIRTNILFYQVNFLEWTPQKQVLEIQCTECTRGRYTISNLSFSMGLKTIDKKSSIFKVIWKHIACAVWIFRLKKLALAFY